MTVFLAGRWFLFGLGLVLSLGKIKFWIFPNLDNEKLGFLDSFKPFYSLEYKDATKGSKGGKKKKKDKGASGKLSGELEPSAGDDKGGEDEGSGEGVEESEEAGEAVADKESKQTEQVMS